MFEDLLSNELLVFCTASPWSNIIRIGSRWLLDSHHGWTPKSRLLRRIFSHFPFVFIGWHLVYLLLDLVLWGDEFSSLCALQIKFRHVKLHLDKTVIDRCLDILLVLLVEALASV